MRFSPGRSIYDLFDQHAGNIVLMSTELRDMLREFDRLPERQTRIKGLELECDRINHELAGEMHSSFILALDQNDISAIINGLDDVADSIDDVATRITLYQIPQSSPDAASLAELVLQSVTVLQEAISHLRNLSRRPADDVCREIKRLEHEGDEVYRGALGRLFNAPGIDPILLFKWQEVYELLERALDQCDDVANCIEGIQLKYG
jgi:uncharacterized protein